MGSLLTCLEFMVVQVFLFFVVVVDNDCSVVPAPLQGLAETVPTAAFCP